MTGEHPIKEVLTTEMIIPEVPEGYIIFDLGNKPGLLSVGTRGHFSLEKFMGYAPYEIDLYTAVQWLNDEYRDVGDKATLRYCGDWTEEDEKLLVEISEAQEEICEEIGVSVEEWQDDQVAFVGEQETVKEDPFVQCASLFDMDEEDLKSHRRWERHEKRIKNKIRDQERREAREMKTDIPIIWDKFSKLD